MILASSRGSSLSPPKSCITCSVDVVSSKCYTPNFFIVDIFSEKTAASHLKERE